jgi:hypothetical protein
VKSLFSKFCCENSFGGLFRGIFLHVDRNLKYVYPL